jgi:hypothetical protein
VAAALIPLLGHMADRAQSRAAELDAALMTTGPLPTPLTTRPWHLYPTIGVLVAGAGLAMRPVIAPAQLPFCVGVELYRRVLDRFGAILMSALAIWRAAPRKMRAVAGQMSHCGNGRVMGSAPPQQS